MSGFFSLGSGAIGIGKVDEQHHHHHHHLQDQQHDDGIITPYSLYLFKNEEIYTKSFELWQQSYQFQHLHQQPPHYDRSHRRKSSSVSSGTGGGGGGGCVDDLNHNASSWNISGGGGGGGCKVMSLGGYGIGGGSGGGGGGMNCQDCGNQAKKDCEHMRCRTCCKSRGFHCQTHVKSTWVPAAKRRERQHQLISLTEQQNLGNQQLSLMMRAGGSGGGGGGDSGGDHNPKRLREDHHQHHQQPSIAVAGSGGGGGGGMGVIPQHHNTCSGLEMGHFPAEVNSPAVFRCVRVSAMDDAEEQLAYQTALNIGGHVFKGILYDHGPEEGTSSAAGAGGGGGGQLQQLITSGGTTAAATATTSIHPAVNFIDPSSTYPTPFSAFMAGTQFFPPPRS